MSKNQPTSNILGKPQVILLTGIARYGQDAGIRKGIHRYRKHQLNWRLVDGGHTNDLLSSKLKLEKPNGIIARISNKQMANRFKRLNIPVIDLNHEDSPFTSVVFDPIQLGCIASEHLISLGFKKLSYIYIGGFIHEKTIWHGFENTSLASGIKPSLMQIKSFSSHKIKSWLKKIHYPHSIYCSRDSLGSLISQAAEELNIKIPQQLVILGTGNVEDICELSSPPLSSIATPDEQIGFLAAELLSLKMSSKIEKDRYLSEPFRIITRRSTSLLAESDPIINQAMHFIETNYQKPISIQDIANHTTTSRRNLERRFKKLLKSSPLIMLENRRIQHVKELLLQSDFTMSQIARLAGFANPDRMNYSFKKHNHCTPGKFRKDNRV